MELAAKVGYDGTYVLKNININSENDKFSIIKLKIERAFLKKYRHIYNVKRDIAQVTKKLDELWNTLEELWKWYDNIQMIFDKKVYNGVDSITLENKMYEFYAHALNRLDVLDEDSKYE